MRNLINLLHPVDGRQIYKGVQKMRERASESRTDSQTDEGRGEGGRGGRREKER